MINLHLRKIYIWNNKEEKQHSERDHKQLHEEKIQSQQGLFLMIERQTKKIINI